MLDTIFTIGHSTRTIEEFISLLNTYDISLVVDVRTIPKSRHNPQFGEDEISKSLKAAKIKYKQLPLLGGLRPTTKDSINMAWRNTSFRGFADYMQTKDFEKGIGQLLKLAKKDITTIMCAEAVPWRCHRSLIGDALLVRDIKVCDIMTEKSLKPHKLIGWAHVQGTTVTYPGEQIQLF